MTSTPHAKAGTPARVAGFLALLAGGAVLLVLFAAAACAALSASSPQAHAAGMHRPGAAPHVRHQQSGLRTDAGRPGHQLRTQRADCRSADQRPAHRASRTHLAALRRTHKAAASQRVQGVHHAHTQSPQDPGWVL
jgi:hypothetical protein